jgi:hypothetical protein
MTTDREKPGVAFWATVVLVVVLVYLVSFGPMYGITCAVGSPILHRTAHVIYRPLAVACRGSDTATRLAFWYADFWKWKGPPRKRGGISFPPGFTLEIEGR